MKIRVFLFSFILCACGSMQVDYDYDQATDFSNYKTYNYYPDLQTGLSELDSRRLLEALDAALQTKGIQFSEEADFLINIESREFQSAPNNSVGVGVGGTGRNMGGGVSIGLPIRSNGREREIIFDFIDNQKDVLFWQAISRSNFRENATPLEREMVLNELVTKVLQKYPPKK